MTSYLRADGLLSVALSVSALTLAPVALAGPDWDEGALDAGSTLGSAQAISVNGGINTITGKLAGSAFMVGDYQDCFLVYIDSPQTFSISTSPGAGGASSLDPMLFLFRVEAGNFTRAIMANNDFAGGSSAAGLRASTNDGSGVTVSTAGLYLIAISGFASQPIDATGAALFNQAFLQPGVIAGPGPGSGDLNLFAWNAEGSSGTYVLTLEGVSGVPAPGALSLLALGGLIARKRRR